MIEVLWHGRGGQGAFTAARLLGAAASMAEGASALAFPSFGPERRGAPMRAFTKVSDRPIGDRSAITRADYVIYLDDTLLAPGWESELKPGGIALVNSVKTPESLLSAIGAPLAAAVDGSSGGDRLLTLDANGISSELLGRAIPNTVFLGALSLLCDQVPFDAVGEAVRQYMPPKLHEKNLAIVAEARHAMAQALAARAVSRQARDETAEGAPADVSRETGFAAMQPRSAEGAAPGERRMPEPLPAPVLRSPTIVIPRLRDHLAAPLPSLEPRDFAQSTCYQAGHLVSRNAGWRNVRPVLAADLCTGCLQCYLYCPDGTIVRTYATKDQLSAGDASLAAVAIDYDFCKGCGICAKACRFDAIAMISEEDVLAAERQIAEEDAVASVGVSASDASASHATRSGVSADAASGDSLADAFLSDYESEGGAR